MLKKYFRYSEMFDGRKKSGGTMIRTVTILAILLLPANNAFAFASKNLKVAELNQVTESQVTWTEEERKAHVMVRGRGAELLYRMIKEERKENLESDALTFAGRASSGHWSVKGQQVICSKMDNKKKTKSDYACAFSIDEGGSVNAGVEPFDPVLFNLAKTNTSIKLFKGKQRTGRALASASPTIYGKSAAYVLYGKSEVPKEGKDTMIVFKDAVARKLLEVLRSSPNSEPFVKNGTKGLRGNEFSCVEAANGDAERCAVVFSLTDGGVSKRKNPLL